MDYNKTGSEFVYFDSEPVLLSSYQYHFSTNCIGSLFPERVNVIFLPFPLISAKEFLYP